MDGAKVSAVTFSYLPQLKKAFTMAPVLKHPDQYRQFIMEVDASDVGVELSYPNILWRTPRCILWLSFSENFSPRSGTLM